ncbi:MAG: beta strand repeat-containing protein [Phycisphaerae bacterium]
MVGRVRVRGVGEFKRGAGGRVVMLAAVVAAALWSAGRVDGGVTNWTGDAQDGLWSTAGNWSGGRAPGVGDSLSFGSATGGTTGLTVDVTGGVTSMIFNGAGDAVGAAAPFSFAAGGQVVALIVSNAIVDRSTNGNAMVFNLPVLGGGFNFAGGGNSAVVFNSGASFSGGLGSTSNGVTSDVFTIGAGTTVSFGNSSSIGVAGATANTTTSLTFTGGAGSILEMSNNFNVGAGNNTGSSKSSGVVVDLTGVGQFHLTADNGNLNVGTGNQTHGTLLLSNGNNSIHMASVNVGNFANGSGRPENLLQLGAGGNTIEAGNLTIGRGVSGSVAFAGAAGEVTIQGLGGAGATANLTIGVGEANTSVNSLNSSLLLAGHAATLSLNTVVIAQNDHSNFNATNAAVMTFDTGVLSANSIQMSKVSSGHGSTSAALTIGGGSVTVNNVFDILDDTLENGNPQASVVNLNGGSVVLNTSMDEIISGSNASAAANATLNLSGGTLDMTGHAIGIGGTAANGFRGNIDHVNMPGAGQTFRLMNLGTSSATAGAGSVADGINGAGVTMDGGGTLILDGVNTYAAGTTVAAGTVVAASAEALGSGPVKIHGGGTLRLQAGLAVAVQVPLVSFDGGPGAWAGSLDLSGDKLIVQDGVTHAASLGNLESAAHSVISSTGLPAAFGIAVLDNGVLHRSTFGGVGVNDDSILIGPELLGDVNADGVVDLTDLSTVLNNFGVNEARWTSGNFDGAATIDLTDLSCVLNNFGVRNAGGTGGALVLGPGGGEAASPEPGSLVIAVAGMAGLLGRRRRR